MKMISILAALLLSTSAFADPTPAPTTPAPAPTVPAPTVPAPQDPIATVGGKVIMTCAVAVQTGQPGATMQIGLVNDPASDFLMLEINDNGTQSLMAAQGEKGSVQAGITSGQYMSLMLDDAANQDASGVIRNAGILVISTDATGNLGGLLVAHSNVYPLSCKAVAQ